MELSINKLYKHRSRGISCLLSDTSVIELLHYTVCVVLPDPAPSMHLIRGAKRYVTSEKCTTSISVGVQIDGSIKLVHRITPLVNLNDIA